MLSVDDALRAVLMQCRPLAGETVALPSAVGRTLRVNVTANRDSPPFTKAMMDGFAVRAEDFAGPGEAGGHPFDILGESAAGGPPPPPVTSGQAVRIMTGAPMPTGADTVIPVEVAAEDGDAVRLPPTAEGKNVLKAGSIVREGATVFAAGRAVTPRAVACLAEFGVSQVQVTRVAKVAYLATGDELVPFEEEAGEGQIRNSSEPMLSSQVECWGATFSAFGIAGDTRESLADSVARADDADVLLLTGGVSAGKYDLVPGVLAAAGFREIFHKVAVKPGKPLWFGVRGGNRPTLAFGLPGNPVSSMLCAEVFVRPALAALHGSTPADPTLPVRLTAGVTQKGDRVTYWPAKLLGAEAEPLPWKGSADLVTVAAADGWLILPAGDRRFEAGESVRFHRPAV